MRRLHAVVGGLLMAVGVSHLGFTPSWDDSLGVEALWFAGAGLFLVSAGLLNVAVLRAGAKDAAIRYGGLSVNLLGAAMAVWAVVAVGGWQPYLLLGLFLAGIVLTLMTRPRAAGPPVPEGAREASDFHGG